MALNVPVAEGKRPHRWIPSTKRGTDEAEPQWGMLSGRPDSTERNPTA